MNEQPDAQPQDSGTLVFALSDVANEDLLQLEAAAAAWGERTALSAIGTTFFQALAEVASFELSRRRDPASSRLPLMVTMFCEPAVAAYAATWQRRLAELVPRSRDGDGPA